jgi:SEC-C motif-containing protein
MSITCPCGSRKNLDRCCGRFLSGAQRAKTPEQLMRSRYTAYALGDHGDYLLRTWFPATARGVDARELSKREVEWTGLEILGSSQRGDSGTVEFRAGFRKPDGTLHTLHEISVFRRTAGWWLYVGGEVSNAPAVH